MLADIKKTAVAAAVTLTLVRLHWIIGQVQLMASVQQPRWIAAAQLAANALFLIPLPVLLWTLYTTRTRLLVSRNLRYLALGTASVYGLFFAVPQLYGLARGLQQSPDLRWFKGATVAQQLWGWLRTPWAGTLAWESLILLSQVAFVLFLIALFRRGLLPEITDGHAQLIATRIATVAVFMGGLAVALNVSQVCYAAVVFGAKSNLSLQYALYPLPNLCWGMAAWIVYKGLRQASFSEPALVC